ncbi:uncharacterized protein ACRADG_002518 isoform 5-T5 [Cochliomyia hominivorax]
MDEVKQKKVALTLSEYTNFFHLNDKNIESLKISSSYFHHEVKMVITITIDNPFENLTQLSYHRMVMDARQMGEIAENCRKLKTLKLLKCYDNKLKSLIPGENFDLINLYRLRNLRELVFENGQTAKAVIEAQNLLNILLNLNLKKLIFLNFIVENNDAIEEQHFSHILEILNVGSITPSYWPYFVYNLENFEQLKELYIKVTDCNTKFNMKVVLILSSKCLQLEKLSLENCDLHVEDFRLLNQLKHLVLISCGGLTFTNFQHILGGLTLKTFHLAKTRIYGVIYHTYITPSLEEITIDTIHFMEISEAFQMSFNKSFENLHTLRWLKGNINDNWLLEKCPQLRTLHIPNPNLLQKFLLHMTYLRELTFSSLTGVNWNLILSLIRNLNLERLEIKTNEINENNAITPLNDCGVKTTLLEIFLPFAIFKLAQIFWMNLLYLNDSLHYTIYGKYAQLMDGEFLEKLIADEKFCRRVKYIELCGFKMDCLDMKKDFNLAIQNINKYTSYYRYKNANFTLEM